MKIISFSVVSNSIPHGLWATRLLSMEFSRQEYWSGCHSLLQGVFPTQGPNSHLLQLLHCRHILYHWATREAPRITIILLLGIYPKELKTGYGKKPLQYCKVISLQLIKINEKNKNKQMNFNNNNNKRTENRDSNRHTHTRTNVHSS